ncbi:MAG: HDIG domain-containing metalloprotein [Oscillospiraceae bacterium]
MERTLFEEIDKHLLQDDMPSIFLQSLLTQGKLNQPPFTVLLDLQKAEQSLKYHPEGNVWNHTMLVVDEAAKRKQNASDKRVFLWAALLHDIGKPSTTKNKKGKITSYDHDKIGSELVAEFFSYFNEDDEFVKAVSSLVRWHMQILFVVNRLPFAEIETMKKQAKIDEVALLGTCDRLGRLGADKEKELEIIKQFLEKCKL